MSEPEPARLEIAWGLLILSLGLGSRLLFVHLFPTRPVSDFASLVDFGLYLRDQSWTAGGWFWEYFSPGLPIVLSLLLRLFPGPPAAEVCRTATAVVCGLTPLLPFLLWRGVLPVWVRALAGTALALWPGQIAFSGVVAQDNWVLPPTVALGALAARALIARDGGRPVAAGLLYAAGIAMRQEMLVALLPLALAGAGAAADGRRVRRLAVCAVAAGLPLLGLCAQRGLATGRFSLVSEHGGLAMLGAYVPGAAENSWTDPRPWVASVAPGLLRDRHTVARAAAGLALREARRRPVFHAARIASAVLRCALAGEAYNLYWSVSPQVLPPPWQARSALFQGEAARLLLAAELAAVQALFLAALILGALRRQPAILVLAAAIFLKIAIHAVTVAQGRYFLAATALQILAVVLGLWEARRVVPRSRLPVSALAAGTAVVVILALLSPRLARAVQDRDRDEPRAYRFTLSSPGEEGALDCRLEPGRLTQLPEHLSATIEIFHRDPAPGETATALCALRSATPVPLALEVSDDYLPGGLPDRVEQRVAIDGVEVFRHDLAAEPGGGWARIPLGPAGPRGRSVRLEVRAVRPEPGAGWGKAASTTFRLAVLKAPR
ncbi:MAG TPA: hypothetical protein VFC23_21440 [Thermoanaerobaculia bacterium]|nr:hypothetical protein [Thermoanaerobaculia bacterium]